MKDSPADKDASIRMLRGASHPSTLLTKQHRNANMTFLGLPADASPRLKAVQWAQLSIVFLTMIATFLTAVIPQQHKAFTFGLLYTLILSSFTTTIILRKEQQAALKGELTKSKYVKYQVIKLASAFGLSIVGFIAFVASTPQNGERLRPGEQGLVFFGVKVNKYQGWSMWLNFFNWYVEQCFLIHVMNANHLQGLPLG